MSAGIEVRGRAMRLWYRIDGKLHREPLPDPATPDNISRAKAHAQLIALEIKLGRFDIGQHFPNSRQLHTNLFGGAIDRWQTRHQHSVAPSSWASYSSYIENHVRPRWGHCTSADLTVDAFEDWIDQTLTPPLSNTTTRGIITLWRKIFAYHQRQFPTCIDPSAGISVRLADPEDIDPYTRDEIHQLLHTPTEPHLHRLLTCMIWTGLSIHELLPLAIGDIDLTRQQIHISRGIVRGVYRVTKTRRRKRSIQTLRRVSTALREQIDHVKHQPHTTIDVLERDHRKTTQHRLQWLWLCPDTGSHYTYDQIKTIWRRQHDAAQVRYRPPNNGRHTYASQLLTTGHVNLKWLADQLGHGSTAMLHKHYGRFIVEDAQDHLSQIEKALG